MPECPLPIDVLPKPLHKHVDGKSPLPLRMMGAKGLVPAVAAPDLATMLWFLSHDEDPQVRDTATRTAEGLPDRIWGVALRAEGLKGPVLDWLAERFTGRDAAIELLLLNPATPDPTFARLAPTVGQRLVEIVRQNELRLLRHDDIIRGLCRNPSALASTIDGACDFCVRNGLVLLDVPQIVDAYKRVHGVDPTVKPPEDSAAALMAEYHDDLAREAEGGAGGDSAEDQQRKLTITQRIMKMSVAEKIKLATLGNREARTILVRDANKLVSLAAAQSPRITDGEILSLAHSKTASAEILRYIYENRDFLKTYSIRVALVRNPKVPLPTALKFLPTLQDKDIKDLARDRNVPATVQAQAKAWVSKREMASRGPADGKH